MERRLITVRGVVQGVGFRPFVYGLASRLQLAGFVKNRTGSVTIEVEGQRGWVDRFLEELQRSPPPLARIDEIQWQLTPVLRETGFRIDRSDSVSSDQVFISPDVATCPDCLHELFDPADRRFRYPFLNCTNCGPRLTIIQGAPYDRERTTMSGFAMCPACRAEYDDQADRRFHAQPTACSRCGPRLETLRSSGERIETIDSLACFAERLLAGEIGALKGLGGFHLVCDARNPYAVSELRRRKSRDEKPLAIMVRDLEAAAALCEASALERDLLQSRRRPIVLLRKRRPSRLAAGAALPRFEGTVNICEAVAPGNPFFGLMLPYTPLHHLLMDAVDGIPLVMTSGNRSDEPIAYMDDEAVQRLGGIADVFLTHNRPIHVRCDDSVSRIVDGQELPVRRSRGYAPEPIKLPFQVPRPMLALGGQLKGVFALGHQHQAFLSHHLGDLDHFDAYRAFERDILLYEKLFGLQPELIVHDLHPDYASTGYARRRAASGGLELLGVQHHHAHMASCMAEHGLGEPVIGVSFDGTGFGTDGAIWGGEFLVGDFLQFFRAAHLRYVALPGADKAIRQPWRIGVSHLLDAGCDLDTLAGSANEAQLRTIRQMIERRFNSPLTSSAGRLFDAVAAIAGVRARASYEGQAAVELEWLATDVAEDGSYPFDFVDVERESGDQLDAHRREMADDKANPSLSLRAFVIDTRPLIRAMAKDVHRQAQAKVIARRFHSTIVEIVAAACGRIRSQTQLEAVVLSGGVFMNALLTREVFARLESDRFRVYRHHLVPPNDGGLCLGQLAIAAKTYNHGSLHGGWLSP